jgi:hypothetical protein
MKKEHAQQYRLTMWKNNQIWKWKFKYKIEWIQDVAIVNDLLIIQNILEINFIKILIKTDGNKKEG